MFDKWHLGQIKGVFAAAAVVLLLLFAASCNKGISEEQAENVNAGDSPPIQVSSLDPSSPSEVEAIEVAVTPGAGGFDVAVYAGDSSPSLDELFFQLEYNPAEIHAFGIAVDGSRAEQGILALAMESKPGKIDVGLVSPAVSETPAVKAGDALVSFKLLEGPASRTVSSASGGGNRARNLDFTEEDGVWTLSWDYTNSGDTNQDGEVGIQDLTPIGLHYGKQVDNSWDDPLRHIDGDHNSEINLADITPIGSNFTSQLWAYQIEMSEDGESDFITVGQLILGEYNQDPGVTVRFEYEFGAQYVVGAWYRVVGVTLDLQFGEPSEAISESGRRVDPIPVEEGDQVKVVIFAHDIEHPLAHLNAVRVIFPAGFEYVSGSFNAGSPGGNAGDIDGIWGTFATALLVPPETFLRPVDLGDGSQALDFNVTMIDSTLDGSPAGYGDLFNFSLINNGSSDLTLEFVGQSEDSLLRTYYTSDKGEDTLFGNRIGFEVR